MSTKRCSNCGAEIDPSTSICNNCGSSIQNNNSDSDVSGEFDLLAQLGYINTDFSTFYDKKESNNSGNNIGDEKEVESKNNNQNEKSLNNENVSKVINTQSSELATNENVDLQNSNKNNDTFFSSLNSAEPSVINIDNADIKNNVNQNQLSDNDQAETAVKISINNAKDDIDNLEATQNTTDNTIEHSAVNTTKNTVNVKTSPFQSTGSNVENVSTAIDTSTVKYDLPEDFSTNIETDDQDDVFYSSGDNLIDAMERAGIKPITSISAEKPKTDYVKKERNLSEEDESSKSEFDVDAQINDHERKSASAFLDGESGYADEIANDKVYKSDAMADIDDGVDGERDFSKLEGRVNPNKRKKERKRSSRTAEIDKKVYNIEHDKSKIDENDIDYDGYYENVLPIDYGQNKRKINPKIIFAIFAGIGFIAAGTYLIILILGK